MAEKSIGTRIFLGLKICGTISVTLSDSVNCAFICPDSQLSAGEWLGNYCQIVCIFCDIQKAHADGSTKKNAAIANRSRRPELRYARARCRPGRGASGSLAHPGAHFPGELGDEREECFVLGGLSNVIGEGEGCVRLRDERGSRDLAIEMRDDHRNDQRFGVDEGCEAESPRFERQRRALRRGGGARGG